MSAAVVGRCPPAPGRVVKVGARLLPAAGNAGVGPSRANRGGTLVRFGTQVKCLNSFVLDGTTGVVGNGIK